MCQISRTALDDFFVLNFKSCMDCDLGYLSFKRRHLAIILLICQARVSNQSRIGETAALETLHLKNNGREFYFDCRVLYSKKF